jgi:hypothetical protein
MKVLWTIVIVIAVLIALLFAGAFFLPASFSVQRSAVIAAPVDAVYAKFATPRTWASWSAWTTRADSTLVYTYAGPDSGLGAIMRFTSKKMGNGDLEIVEAVPDQSVGYDLHLTGSDMRIHGRIALEPASDGTKVTWHDSGSLGGNVMLRYLGPVLDKSLAAAYETSFQGLRRDLNAR